MYNNSSLHKAVPMQVKLTKTMIFICYATNCTCGNYIIVFLSVYNSNIVHWLRLFPDDTDKSVCVLFACSWQLWLNGYAKIYSIIVTCSEKRDQSGYFIKIEFLAWIDSFMCTESNSASFMKKYWSQVELWPFLYTQLDIFVFWKMCIFN